MDKETTALERSPVVPVDSKADKVVWLNLLPGLGDWVAGRRGMGGVQFLLFASVLVMALDRFSTPTALVLCMWVMTSHALATVYRMRVGDFVDTATAGVSEEAIRWRLAPSFPWSIPLMRHSWNGAVFGILMLLLLLENTEVSLAAMVQGLPTALYMVEGLLTPDWSHLSDAVLIYAKQTGEIALLGTFLGILISLPLSLLCARNLMRHHPVTFALYYFSRSVMVVVRAVPTFLWGLLFVALVGLGPFPGVLAIFLFSVGIMVKLYSEAIENIEEGPTEATLACGGTPAHVILFSVIPQATPALIAQTLYCVEINVHSATVLGLIGAEGIGLPIHEYLTSFAYRSAATYILVTIVLTVVIDYFSAYVRSRLLRI